MITVLLMIQPAELKSRSVYNVLLVMWTWPTYDNYNF